MNTSTPGGLSNLLNPEAVAEVLGVSQSQVRTLAREGALPVVRVGGVLRFKPEAVAEFINQGGTTVARD